VLAHVRKATQGDKTVLNCHPFQYGRWVFAHNGDIPDFGARREALVAEIAPELRGFVLGDTDSEVIFFIFLSELRKNGALGQLRALGDVVDALRATVHKVRALCDPTGSSPALLTLMVTDGELLAATEGGRQLFWSSYKNRCADRDRCPSLGAACEAPSTTGHVNHFLVSSEPLSGENVWLPFDSGEVIGIDREMNLYRSHIEKRGLPLLLTA
jgi:glutamine amidotransferase